MGITNYLGTILGNLWLRIIIFILLLFSTIFNFLNYKKGIKIARYYAIGFFFILIAFIIQILKSPLKPGSVLDILGLIMFSFFLIAGLYNIFYLTSKK